MRVLAFRKRLFPLRHERRKSEADPFPEGYQPSMYPGLPGHFPFTHTSSVPGGLRYLRLLRGTDVARYLLPGSRLSKRRRHFYVRHVRPGRRHRLLRRSRRGRDHLPVYRKNESWDPYRHPLPVRNADTGIPLETSEAGIKAGYLLRNNLELKKTAVQRPRQAGVRRFFIYKKYFSLTCA